MTNFFFIFLIFGFVIKCDNKNQNEKNDYNNKNKIENLDLKQKEIKQIKNKSKIENQEINQLLYQYSNITRDKNTYRNKIKSDHPLVKTKIKIEDLKINSLDHIKKVILFGFGDSVSCSNKYGNGGIVQDFGYFTQLGSHIKGFSEIKTIADDISIIQNHYDSLKRIKYPYPKDIFAVITFTTIGNNFLHPFGIVGRKGGPNKQHFKVPDNLEVNEAELYGVSIKDLKLIYGPLLRNYLELIYAELKRIFPGGFHLFIANIYDPTDGTGRFDEIHFNGKKNRLPYRKEGLEILNYINLNIINDFANSHSNASLVDSNKALLGYGIKKYGTDQYCYMNSIFEDPNEFGSKKIMKANMDSIKNYLPEKIMKLIKFKN